MYFSKVLFIFSAALIGVLATPHHDTEGTTENITASCAPIQSNVHDRLRLVQL